MKLHVHLWDGVVWQRFWKKMVCFFIVKCLLKLRVRKYWILSEFVNLKKPSWKHETFNDPSNNNKDKRFPISSNIVQLFQSYSITFFWGGEGIKVPWKNICNCFVIYSVLLDLCAGMLMLNDPNLTSWSIYLLNANTISAALIMELYFTNLIRTVIQGPEVTYTNYRSGRHSRFFYEANQVENHLF